jgi:hypothetical protein
MKRILPALAGAALGAIALSTPAMADQPEAFMAGGTFEDVNPCTGNLQEVDVVFAVTHHTHARNEVILVSGNFESSEGYRSSAHGLTNVAVINPNWFIQPVHIRMTNPETGGVYRINGMFTENLRTGEVHLDRESITCVRFPD